MQEKTKSKRWTAWLIYAIMILALISTTTLSRYMTTVTGSGVATVAAVDMHGSFVSNPTEVDVSGMTPGTVKYTIFEVVNFTGQEVSDVSQTYTITINTTDNLPLTYDLQCISTNSNGTGIYTSAFTRLIPGSPSVVGTLPHTTATTHRYQLKVTWPAGSYDPNLANEVDAVTLVVDSQQIMPGGS